MPLTPQSDLRDLVVLALRGLAGKARRTDVLDEMDRLFGGMFTPEDRAAVPSRPFEQAWRNRASWERANMVREGLLMDRHDRIWELTPYGRSYLDRITGLPSSHPQPTKRSSDPLPRFAPKDSSDYLSRIPGRELVKSRTHEKLVRDYGLWANHRGFTALTLHPRDLVLRHADGEWLVEAKVLYNGNATQAVRAAVGQLFTYRFFLYDTFTPSLLGLFSEPIGEAYVDFLKSLSIAAVWRSKGSWAGSSVAVAAGLAVAE